MAVQKLKVIIIAAGLGSRLMPLTKNQPKCLLKFKKNKSLLQHQIEVFRKNNLKNINIIVGHKKKEIQKLRYRCIENKDYKKNNILNSLFSAKKIIKGNILISYSDIIFKSRLIKRILSSKSDITVLVDKKWKKNYKNRKLHPISEAEKIIYDKNFNVKKAGKILTKGEASGEMVGLLKLTSNGSKIFHYYFKKAKRIFKGKKFYSAKRFENAYITDFINYLVQNHVEVKSSIISGGWMEIDTIEDLKRAASF